MLRGSGAGGAVCGPGVALGLLHPPARLFPKTGEGVEPKSIPTPPPPPRVPGWGIFILYTHVHPVLLQPRFPSLKRSYKKKKLIIIIIIQSRARPARSNNPVRGAGWVSMSSRPPHHHPVKYFCGIKTFIRYIKNKTLTARQRAEASSGAEAEPDLRWQEDGDRDGAEGHPPGALRARPRGGDTGTGGL